MICVPDLTVIEPIAWEHIPYVIARIEIVVDEWLARGVNEPYSIEAAAMYKLRKKELLRRSLDLNSICET